LESLSDVNKKTTIDQILYKSFLLMLKCDYSNFAMLFRGNEMDELSQVMTEMEERLEVALDNMEFGTDLSADDIDVIRAACGKPNNKRNMLLQSVFEDFGNVFGGKL
jgi:hypothetical protein